MINTWNTNVPISVAQGGRLQMSTATQQALPSVPNAGTIVLSLGQLAVGGELALLDNATMALDLNETDPGASYGTISTGDFVLNGRLRVGLESEFRSPVEETYEFLVLESTNLSRAFDNAANGQRISTDDGWFTFQVNYGGGRLFESNQVFLSEFNFAGDYNDGGREQQTVIDASNTVSLFLEPVTPRIDFLSESGHDYRSVIPEPASALLLLSAVGLLLAFSRRWFRGSGLRRTVTPLLLIIATAPASIPAFGQNNFWVAGGTGNWNVAANWSAGVPTTTSSVQVNNGGTAQLFDPGARGGPLYLGFNPGNTGALEVVGGEGTFNFVDVGSAGTGTLQVRNGGRLFGNTFGRVAAFEGSTGNAVVNGAGSVWSNVKELSVGNFGAGTLQIEAGGEVFNTDGYLAFDAGANGTATVTGADSMWSNLGSLFVGNAGNATLNIQNDGAVSNASGVIGNQAGSTGSVAVSGAGSLWITPSGLSVGNVGNGTLNITDGGFVNSGVTDISQVAGSTGKATVSGNGSRWYIGSTDFNLGSSFAVGRPAATGRSTCSTGGPSSMLMPSSAVSPELSARRRSVAPARCGRTPANSTSPIKAAAR